MRSMIVYIPAKDCNWKVRLPELMVSHEDTPRRFKKFQSLEQMIEYLIESKAELVWKSNGMPVNL